MIENDHGELPRARPCPPPPGQQPRRVLWVQSQWLVRQALARHCWQCCPCSVSRGSGAQPRWGWGWEAPNSTNSTTAEKVSSSAVCIIFIFSISFLLVRMSPPPRKHMGALGSPASSRRSCNVRDNSRKEFEHGSQVTTELAH